MGRPQHADLTRGNDLVAIQGQPVVKVAETTLKSAERLLLVWEELEPLARRMVVRLRTVVERDELALDADQAAKLLQLTARVIQQLGGAAANVLRASEGQTKLALLLESGRPQRTHPGALTEKQLSAVVIETVKKIKESSGSCPICVQQVTVVDA